MTDKKVQSDFYDKDYFVPREYSYEVVRVCHSGDVVHYSSGAQVILQNDSIVARDINTDIHVVMNCDRMVISGSDMKVGTVFKYLNNSKRAFPLQPTYDSELEKNNNYLKTIKSLHPNNRVLEIGCGFGFLLKMLINDGMHAEGCDISKYAIDNCSVDKNLIKQCDIRDGIPHESKSFDVVITCDTLEHIDMPYINNVIKNICRISRKWVIIGVPISLTSKNEPFGDESHVLFMHPSFWISRFYGNNYLIDLSRSRLFVDDINDIKMNYAYLVFYCGD